MQQQTGVYQLILFDMKGHKTELITTKLAKVMGNKMPWQNTFTYLWSTKEILSVENIRPADHNESPSS